MDRVRTLPPGAGVSRHSLGFAWLGGVSLIALLMANNQAHALNLKSSATVAPTAAAAQAAAAAASQAASAGAQAQVSLSRAAAALAAARKAQQDAAAALSGLPRLGNGQAVPDGVAPGGLMPTGGVSAGGGCGVSCTTLKLNTPESFNGASSTLTQTTDGGQTTVSLTQTQKQAIYNWDSFNISRSTTLNFNQKGSDWSALNRVNPDVSPVLFLQQATANNGHSNPSYIGGKINAAGNVYVINRNGIIFGAGSQINVHSLVASVLDVGTLTMSQSDRDNYFLTTGVAGGDKSVTSFALFDSDNGKSSALIPGNVTVEAGASITSRIATDVDPNGSPGFIYLFGANVTNNGTLISPQGEVAMAAARAVKLTPGEDQAANFPSNVLPSGVTLRATGVQIQNFGTIGADGNPVGTYYRNDALGIVTGEVSHGGVIDVRQGTALLAGDRVSVTHLQDPSGNMLRDTAGNLISGVISADTSVSRNSMVLMHAATSVQMDGVISMLPYDDGNTLPMSSGGNSANNVQTYTPAYVEMGAQLNVAMGSGGLISAPSAAVSLRAAPLGLFNFQGENPPRTMRPSLGGAQQVLLSGAGADGPGAVIDVAGLQNVVLPASYNFVSFQPRGEFADMPLQRSGALYGQTLWVDIRNSGVRSDGTTWVGTPLADASGVIGNVGRSINQLMTAGGTVSLTTQTDALSSVTAATNRQVITNSGAVINVAGGRITYEPGIVPTTRLLGSDGRFYSMASADPNLTYLGIAGQFTRDHPRWGVTESWSMLSQTYSPGYTEGHDAGGINVTTLVPQLGGQMYFGSVAGQRQISFGKAPSDATDSTSGTALARPTALQANGDELPSQGVLAISTPSTDVQIGPVGSSNFIFVNPLTKAQVQDPVAELSAETLSGYGLSLLQIAAPNLVVSAGSTLNLAAGGQFKATVDGAIDIAGTVAAAGGKIALSTTGALGDPNKLNVLTGNASLPVDRATGAFAGNIFVEGTLDVSGRFVNDTGRSGADALGPAFINGGSISIATNKSSVGTKDSSADRTGSILLAKGSVLDVSSGAYISSQGKAKTASTGVLAGKGGSISLSLYRGSWAGAVDNSAQLPPVASADNHHAVLQLDGTLRAYGLENNGSLTLRLADTVRIGGTLLPGEIATIRAGQGSMLPTALFNSGGFSSYTIESNSDDYTTPNTAQIILSENAALKLRQTNLSSVLNYATTPTGGKLGAGAQLAQLPDDQRKPVDLVLKADNVVLATGSSITTDPRAKITVGGSPVLSFALDSPLRDKPANKVQLGGSIVDHGGTVFINAVRTILDDWLPKQQARVDLSGTVIANSFFNQPGGPATGGTVIPGGTFTIEAGTPQSVTVGSGTANYFYSGGGGLVQAGTGLQVDVSGYAGEVQVAAGRGLVSSTWLWSDAGTVSIDAATFSWGGSFAATGGRLANGLALVGADGRTAVANNGTLILGGGQIALNTTDPSRGSILVSTDQLAPFDNVFLYSGSGNGGAGRIFTDLPLTFNGLTENTAGLGGLGFGFLPFTIAGGLDWHVANRLHIAASSITTVQDGSNVKIEAPYILLTGAGTETLASGSRTISISAQDIDLEFAAFSGFKQVQISSAGDLRLSTPKIANSIDSASGLVTTSSFTGELKTSGNLLLSAQRIYPVSAVAFNISTPGNVTFAAPAGSKPHIPLSAGGTLTVNAANIDQGGNLFAPLGKIKLIGGAGTNADGSNQGVVLEPGSLTSVSLADTIVPYGATADGTGWYYNASGTPLLAPPAKGLELDGASVQVRTGSVIDERGGGDLQAMEWISGNGGTHDTLSTINGGLANGSGAGSTVYALLPSTNDPIAAFDIHFTAASSVNAAGQSGARFTLPSGQVLYLQSGDSYPLAGSQITIAGGSGVPAGSYTLYPAHYATLPGALRVTYYGDATGRNTRSGITLTDGTVLVTGNYTQSTAPGKQSSGQALFALQTGAVWRQYSEYSLSGANSYFAQLAAHNGTAVPRLPIDAGRLALTAQQQVLLAGTALVQPAPGGRGSELDIAGNKLALVSHQQYVDGANPGSVPAGYLPIDVSQLNAFGFESVLVGGARSDNDPSDPAKGTLITPTSTSVVVDTRGEALTVPELLLVTQAKGQWVEQDQWFTVGSTRVYVPLALYQPAADDGSIDIRAGSIIATTGKVDVGYGRDYHFAPVAASSLSRAQEVAASLGGTLQSDGTTITGVDLTKLGAFWYGSDWKPLAATKGVDPTSLAYYAFGGPTTKQPGLGAVFAASNDATLALSGPTGVPVQPLTVQFADMKSGAVAGVQGGAVQNLDGSAGAVVLPGSDAGRVTIAAGAVITTDTLTLQATASTRAIGISGDLHARQVNLTAPTIAIGSGAASGKASVQLSGTQFADVKGLSVKALSGAISVYGSFDAGASMTSMSLDAAALVRATGSGNGSITVENGTLKLVNDSGLGLPAGLPAAESGTSLAFNAATIVLGGGTQTIAGASTVSMTATDHVAVATSGTLTLGGAGDPVDLAVFTPSVLVAGATSAGSGSFTLTTRGGVTLADLAARTATAQRPGDSSELGGNFAVVADHIAVATTIQAQAGTLTLEATGGDGSNGTAITLADGAYLVAGGYAKTLVDVTTYVAGGRVLLQADPAAGGSVSTSTKSVIDVAQPANGIGYGGQIEVAATAGSAVLLGDLRGQGGPGLGGSFKVDAKNLQVDGSSRDSQASRDVKLDGLADKLLAGGVSGGVDIHTRTGNLTLSIGHTLMARAVTLTADDASWDAADPNKQFGQITIAGTIDASGYAGTTADGTGQAGGQVGLYGANQITLAGSSVINASTMHADERGGDVTAAIPWAAKGKIRLQDGMTIDVSGGTKGGLSGGTVTFRAPVDGNGGAKIVQIGSNGQELAAFDGSRITVKGARSVAVEPFIAIDTVANSRYGLDGSKLGWDGLIDPASLYDSQGNPNKAGVWTGVPVLYLNFSNLTSGFTRPPSVFIQNAIQASYSVSMGLANSVQLTTSANLNVGDQVTFATPSNGQAAQGTVASIANGVITVAVARAGSGYTSVPTAIIVNGTSANATISSGFLKPVAITCNPCVKLTSTGTFFLVNGGNPGTATGSITFGTLTGSTDRNGNFTLDSNPTAASTVIVTISPINGSRSYTPTTFTYDTLIANNATVQRDGQHKWFAATDTGGNPGTLMAFVQNYQNNGGTSYYIDSNGSRLGFVDPTTGVAQNYSYSKLISSLEPLAQQLGAGVVHVRPGVELVNSDPNTNSGNISVKSTWNLGSGSAHNLATNTQPNGTVNGSRYVQVYDTPNPAQQSYVTLDYRLFVQDGYGTGAAALEAGALTLRAVNDVVIGASISDGFFQFGNARDPAYLTSLAAYLGQGSGRALSSNGGYLDGWLPIPLAPYQASGNVASPTAVDLASADLFPNQLKVCGAAANCTITDPGSWSYRITAGADLASANPNAVRPLTATLYNPTGRKVYNNNQAGLTPAPSVTMTGVASYTPKVYDGVSFVDGTAVNLPTLLRTGTGSIDVASAYDIALNNDSNITAPGAIYAAGVNTPKLSDPQYRLQAANGTSQLVVGNISADAFLEPLLLAYSSSAKDIYGPLTAAAFPHRGGDVDLTAQNDVIGVSTSAAKTSYQYYTPWLISAAAVTPATQNAASSVRLSGQGVFVPFGTSIATQTAWWIQYGSFDQGVLSAGGNVSVTAGRDVNDLSVSLPTTGRVSGGLTATSTPVTHLYDSGSMTVSAGRDILGGSFYEGSGHGSVVAGRAVGATTEKLSWIGLDRTRPATTLDNLPLLAVDLGQIQLTAGGAISVAGVVNPAALRSQTGTYANPVSPDPNSAIFMDTYGPQSGVSLQSLTGDLTVAISPTSINATTSSLYPASFAAVALGGAIKTTGLNLPTSTSVSASPGLVLSGSEQGNLELLAEGSIDLTFGAAAGSFVQPSISAGPALLNKAFNPYRPDAWYGSHPGDATYGGGVFGAVLAHQNDDAIARIVAATGDITAAGQTLLDVTTRTQITGFNRVEINHPVEIYAGGDITDLNLLVENIRPSDVSSVVAQGNITYTGKTIAGGLQVAGPGFFVVQAGGDLGPFLPVAADTNSKVKQQQGIASLGNASFTPVGNDIVSTGVYDATLLGPTANPRRNELLGTSGADVIAMFGVSKKIAYDDVVDAYVNPAKAANVPHNYLGELQAFLARIGKPSDDPFAAFAGLPASLKNVFIDQVFFAELKAVASQTKPPTARGFKIIETMFPASYGYTDNERGSLVKTGDLNLLHATIQTRQGGDVSIFGPGGSIFVGPLATEPNPNLKLSDLGILTLGGGAINTFTDESVRVNSSRVLTTQGGDVLMWSSNGDLDAGRGSKTTLSFPPLQVYFDRNDYEFIDLAGFVTGAGIGTVKASRLAKPSNLYLLAPRGVIDFGTAGARATGNLLLVAPVVVNSSNIQVQGSTSGIPTVTLPNTSGLTSAANSGAAASKSAETPTASGKNDRASVFIVEIISFGGGDGAADEAPGSGATPAEPATVQPGAKPPAEKNDDRKKRS